LGAFAAILERSKEEPPLKETVPVAQVATTIEGLPPGVAEALGELAGAAKEGYWR